MIALFLFSGCANSPQPTATTRQATEPTQDSEDPQQEILADLTDKILLALATRNYRDLKHYIVPVSPAITGRSAASLLLGEKYHSLLLDRWNPSKFEVLRSDDTQWANVSAEVSYRSSPNRNSRLIILNFLFYRPDPQTPFRWYPRQP